MRCIYCEEKAGFFKKLCRDCQRLIDVLRSAPASYGYRQLLDHFFATGVPNEKIQKFLDKDIGGQGSLNDQITARMTNEVMASLGQPSSMSSTDVKQVRKDIAEGRAPSLTDSEVISHDSSGDL